MVMPMNSFGMGTSGNIYDSLKTKYSCGYIDRAERPKIAGYPVDIISEPQWRPKKDNSLKSWFRKLFQ